MEAKKLHKPYDSGRIYSFLWERYSRQEANRMPRRLFAYLGAIFATLFMAFSVYGQSAPAPTRDPAGSLSYQSIINKYCVVCHNDKAQMGGLMLDHADLAKIPEQAAIWEKVARKLRSGMMPPQGMPHPTASQLEELASMLEAKLDAAAFAKPNPGPTLLRRLTRTEYGNAVHDLLALDDVDVTSLLPTDSYSDEGFDNLADSLTTSPVLMERYLSAAWKISALAVGTPKVASSVQVFRPRDDLSQDQHVEGLPVETRGGILVNYNFPADGEYILRPKLFRNVVRQVRGLELPTQFQISIDGARVHLAEFGGSEDEAFSYNAHVVAGLAFEKRLEVRLPLKAGPHTVGFAFLKKSSAVPIGFIQPLGREKADRANANTGIPELAEADIVGPLNPTQAQHTSSRRRIFVCSPPDDDRDGGSCARQILGPLAYLAYRRPLTKDDMDTLLSFYETGRKQEGAETGIETALSYMLSSPEFVLRPEIDSTNVPPGAAYHISDLDLATRLSFFIWSSIPDGELLRVAEQGKLKDPLILTQQVRRMMSDRRSSAFVTNFADEWLHLRNLKAANPIETLFPDFDDNLRQSYLRETELFFESIIRENRNILDLMNANYTFVNERLARQYGISGIYGSEFRRVTITDDNRRGLLGQGSILTVTSYGNRTSPVKRGKFVLSNFFGNPPPPMPANVPPLNETVDPNKPQSMRQRMESHRSNPVCANCHRLMDPVGFAMENFDATGKWRPDDGGATIDTKVRLAEGSDANSVADVRKAIVSRPEQFVGTVTEALMTYALGRQLGPYDMPAVRTIVRNSARDNYTFLSLVLGIAQSVPFEMNMKQEDSASRTDVAVNSGARDALSNLSVNK